MVIMVCENVQKSPVGFLKLNLLLDVMVMHKPATDGGHGRMSWWQYAAWLGKGWDSSMSLLCLQQNVLYSWVQKVI